MKKKLRQELLEKLQSIDIVREQIIKRFSRSAGWSKVRKHFLKDNPFCAVCGTKHNLDVHHITPFKENPLLELEPSNLITLCGKFSHHLTFGHLMSFKKYNPSLKEDISLFTLKIQNARKIDGDLET